MELQAQILADRQASYARLRGGFPVPMAGIVYWLAVAGLALYFPPAAQLNLAFFASGLIFPLALLLAAIFRNNFMKDRTATGSVLVPAFISMLLFWPMLIITAQSANPDAVLVILAIGMSVHWPVIGWSYGRTALYTGHSIVRAIAVVAVWAFLPSQRFFAIPLAVAIVYALTVIAIVVDAGQLAKKISALEKPAP